MGSRRWLIAPAGGAAAWVAVPLLLAGAVSAVTVPVVRGSAEGSGPPGRAYLDEPPAGFSGGFGEPSCDACHFSFDVNDPAGALRISGVPPHFIAGETYALDLILTRPGMEMGGVQLTARFEDGGAQAGALQLTAEAAERLTIAESFDIQYAQHRSSGTTLTARDTVRWQVLWTAPESGGTVRFHAAGNAADGDESQFGDYIYTAVEVSRP